MSSDGLSAEIRMQLIRNQNMSCVTFANHKNKNSHQNKLVICSCEDSPIYVNVIFIVNVVVAAVFIVVCFKLSQLSLVSLNWMC